MAAPYLVEPKWPPTRPRPERWALLVDALGMTLPRWRHGAAVSAGSRRIAEATGAMIGTALGPRIRRHEAVDPIRSDP